MNYKAKKFADSITREQKIFPVVEYDYNCHIASLYVFNKPSFLAFSQARLTKSGRAAAFPAKDLRPNSIVDRSVPILTKDARVRPKIRLQPQRGTGTFTQFNFTSFIALNDLLHACSC